MASTIKVNELDKCIYIKDTKNGYVILRQYIYDILIVDNNNRMIKSTKDMLNSRFNMKYMALAGVS